MPEHGPLPDVEPGRCDPVALARLLDRFPWSRGQLADAIVAAAAHTQTTIGGGEEPLRANAPAPVAATVAPLFDFPAGIRGQLAMTTDSAPEAPARERS